MTLHFSIEKTDACLYNVVMISSGAMYHYSLIYLGAFAGILLIGVLLFVLIYFFSRNDLHRAVIFLSLFGLFFVVAEIGITLCYLNSEVILGRQIHRLQALSVAFFIFGIPYFLYSLAELNEVWHAINHYIAYACLCVFIAIAVIAFAAPELFVSQSESGARFIRQISYYSVRGKTGSVYTARDVILTVMMLYMLFVLLVDLRWHKHYKYIIYPLIASILGIGSALLDYLYIYGGMEDILRFRGHSSYFSFGITFFIFFIMVGSIRKFIDETRSVEKAQKIESLGVLAGGIAHDFNNLLTGIMGNISLAKLEALPGSRIYDTLGDAEKAALRARDLIKQLLTFSKGGEPVRHTASIKAIIVETVNFTLSGSNIHCTYQMEDDLKHVLIDSGQIAQVIQNIVLNARQAMPQGGKITIKAENATIHRRKFFSHDGLPMVKITISDSGPGIPNSLLEKIFDPYFTTKVGGNGLGLAISYSIVKKHGGDIEVTSKKGEGTTFQIFLPAVEDIETVVPSSHNGKAITSGTILVMDDDEAILGVMKGMLSRIHYNIIAVKNGTCALEEFRKDREGNRKICCLFLDLTVPGDLGGKEIIGAIREIDPHIKAVVMSGYSNDEVMANHEKYGFDAALTKPFGYEEVRKILESVLG